ncbi:hypothetical protein C0992_011915 [Termitomyces sp. T32_za158]|nr:hypothetical protein C0992_011915 [Termitomyces sp. T32_za158]
MDNPARDEEMGFPTSGGVPARQRSSISSFLFISFMLFMLTSRNGDEYLARSQYQQALQSLTDQLGDYTAWMNGANSEFSVPDRDPIVDALLDDFNIHGSYLNPQEASYYSNVTGFIHAAAHYHNITPTALLENVTAPWSSHAQTYMDGVNETAIVAARQGWNWTATDKMALSVVEKFPTHINGTTLSDTTSLVHGRIELTDALTNEDLRLEFEGVHFVRNGSIYGLAEPPGHHIDIRLLPSLVPISSKNEIARLIEPELTIRIDKLKNAIDAGVIDSDNSNDDPPKSTCPFIFYAQLHPTNVPEYLMQELEEEIQKPTGVWTISPPKLVANGLLVSKECGLMFEMNETEGLRSRAFFRKVTTYASCSGLAYLALLVLFSRQSERSRTPSGLARVSRWMFLSQSTVDSVSFAGHITFAILAEGRPSISLIAPAFLAYFLACPKNVLDIEPRRWVYVLTVFVCLQGIVVMLQDWLGPNFFLPKRYLEIKTYDYHPPLPMPDPEAPEQSLGDCAICMDAIVVDSRGRSGVPEKEIYAEGESGSKKSSGLLSGFQMGIEGAGTRRIYSLAPCSHLFVGINSSFA